MSTMIEGQFSTEDYLLIEANQLGSPLSIYRLKPSYIRFIRRIGLFIFLIGIVVLPVVIVGFIRVKSNDPLDFLVGLLAPAYAMFKGGVIYRIEVRRARSVRMIVCEQGLLQARRKIKRDCVEVVRWKDILEIRKEFIGKSYYLECRGGMPITLYGYYQNLDELVVIIRERSGIEEEE